ncbi:MAG TPA: tetratricopeptide repeat protein [Anaerolineaceae bacterium]|nr:tetratricopeptide repeat protein [Anaerolineaceae bacterium]
MSRRRRRTNPVRVFVLVVLVLGAIYVNQVVVPTIPPPFMPTSTPTREPQSYVTDAQTLEQEGKFAQAIVAYQQAVEIDPQNATNYISMARLQIYTSAYEDAVSSAENALLINRNNATAHALRGWALGFLGDYVAAEGALSTAIELDPNNAVPYAYMAEVLAQKIEAGIEDMSTLDRASEYVQKARDLNANAMETHRARAIINEMAGGTENLEVAVAEYAAAAEINPNIADLYVAMGRVYRWLYMYSESEEAFARAITLNPTDATAHSGLSRTYYLAGNFVRAAQYAEDAIKREPDNPYWHGNYGQVLYKLGRYPDALPHLRLAVRGGTYESEELGEVTVEGTPVSEEPSLGYYTNYGLTLAYVGECGEALEISQYLVSSFPQDEYIPVNAQEMVTICENLLTTGSTGPTEPAEEGATSEETATEAPTEEPAE